MHIYRYCDGSHLTRMINQLTSFNDYKQYGQLGARTSGLFASDGPKLLNCIKKGTTFQDLMDYTDVGSCVGAMASQILDAKF